MPSRALRSVAFAGYLSRRAGRHRPPLRTAEAVADRVEHPVNTYITWGALDDFQAFPFLSLAFDGDRDEVAELQPRSRYEYGGIVFAKFLEQRYGPNDGTTLLALWDAAADSPSPATVYTDFALWRLFASTLDDGARDAVPRPADDDRQPSFVATVPGAAQH